MSIRFRRGGNSIPGGQAQRKIYAGQATGTGSDFTGAPMSGAAATLILPVAPNIMTVRSAWQLYNGNTEVVTGYSEGLYAGGDTHIISHFGDIYWAEFTNIDVDGDAVSVGLMADNNNFTNAFTMEYAPTTRELSFLAVNDPASSYTPVIRSLLIVGG